MVAACQNVCMVWILNETLVLWLVATILTYRLASIVYMSPVYTQIQVVADAKIVYQTCHLWLYSNKVEVKRKQKTPASESTR